MIAQTWKALGWLGVVCAFAASLGPAAPDGGGHADKLVHLAGYATLMFWWAQIVVAGRWRLAVAVALLGAGIELLQGLTPHRLPDPLDALANTAGVLLGWIAARLSPNLPRALARLPAWPG